MKRSFLITSILHASDSTSHLDATTTMVGSCVHLGLDACLFQRHLDCGNVHWGNHYTGGYRSGRVRFRIQKNRHQLLPIGPIPLPRRGTLILDLSARTKRRYAQVPCI